MTPAKTNRPSQRFTITRIEALTPRAGAQYVAWDAELKGFGVRVSPAGAKSFIVKYRLPSGRVRWKTIGRVGKIPLEKARKRAQDDIGIVARGLDPLREIDVAREAQSVAAVAEKFLSDYVEARRSTATARLYRLAVDSYIAPRLGTIPIGDLTTADAVSFHDALRATPVMANRALAVLSKLVAWSMTAKYRPQGPNICHGIEKYEEVRRRRYLDDVEYGRLGRALRTAAIAPGPRTAITLLLLTGARPAEIASLQWEHVNLKAATLHLPTSKTGAKTIYLSPAAVLALKRWPRFAGSPYVFPGTARDKAKPGAHLHPSTLAHVWAELRIAAKLGDDVRLYDACRHSYASTAVSQHGLTLAQIGEQLGHSQPATTARYAHLHDDVAKRNATAIGGTIAAALKRRQR